jgi:hypothetical protein
VIFVFFRSGQSFFLLCFTNLNFLELRLKENNIIALFSNKSNKLVFTNGFGLASLLLFGPEEHDDLSGIEISQQRNILGSF